ncbi:MAG: hypothetical protein AAFV07_20560, partial [Bacteroidota bacterium]
AKFKSRLLPTLIRYYAETSMWPERILFAWLMLLLFYRGEWNGVKTTPRDAQPNIHFFHQVWHDRVDLDLEAKIAELISHPEWAHPDLGEPEKQALTTELTRLFERVQSQGIESIMDELTDQSIWI